MKFLKFIRNILILILVLGWVSSGYDYYRITKGDFPLFCIKDYDRITKTESFRGLFYKASRVIKRNRSERLEYSKKITYQFLTKTVNINIEIPKEKEKYVIYIKPNDNNNSTLYLEQEEYDIYLNGIEEVKVKYQDEKESKDLKELLEKKSIYIDNLLNKLSFTGLEEDNTTERYTNIDDSFINKTIYIYRCNTEEVKDIYITLDSKKCSDCCIKKKDTIKQD